MPTRREFIKTTIIAGTAVALFRCGEGKIWAYAQSPKLRKFVAPLPGLGSGIPVANASQTAFGRPSYREGWINTSCRRSKPPPTRR